jgi:hypothetical protein
LYRIQQVLTQGVDSARSVLEMYKHRIEEGKDVAGILNVLRMHLASLLTAGIPGPCSSQCSCAGIVTCSTAVVAAGDKDKLNSVREAVVRGLPAMAAQLLDPAAGHRLDAVRDALQVFRE